MRATANCRTVAPFPYLSRRRWCPRRGEIRGCSETTKNRTVKVTSMGSRFDRHSPELRAQRWHKQCRPRKFVLLLLAFFLLFRNVTPAEVNDVRRVLVLSDFDPIASPGVALLDQAIFTAVSQSRYQIEWYDESLGANLFTDEASQRHIRDWYVRKYQDHKPNF